MENRYVAYFRVSTAGQGRRGLGLEAQNASVHDFLRQRYAVLLTSFTEVETGKRNDRPELLSALHLCKVTGACLVIAKLDRLSRNASFLLSLRDSGVRFVCVDNPEANELTIGILAVVAEDERQRISERTRAALLAAKARGVRLGNPYGASAIRGLGNRAAVERVRKNAEARARDLRPVIDQIRESGAHSLQQIADELTRRGVKTPRGEQWQRNSVRNLLHAVEKCPL